MTAPESELESGIGSESSIAARMSESLCAHCELERERQGLSEATLPDTFLTVLAPTLPASARSRLARLEQRVCMGKCSL
jgi:hypothetical protein